jgi:hypothetical protein
MWSKQLDHLPREVVVEPQKKVDQSLPSVQLGLSSKRDVIELVSFGNISPSSKSYASLES